jgi:hypothetical protein
LYKSHPVCISLPGSRKKGYGTGLGTHNTKEHEVPGHFTVTEKIAIKIPGCATPENTIDDDTKQGCHQYDPVWCTHEKYFVNMAKNTICTIRKPITRKYQLVQLLNKGGLSSLYMLYFF